MSRFFKFPNRDSLTTAALFLGLVTIAFCAFFDASILNPKNIGWISEGDLRQHY